eukprot:COSAG05_NODE_37_length_27688_cov_18.080394_21_plen_139_part_00
MVCSAMQAHLRLREDCPKELKIELHLSNSCRAVVIAAPGVAQHFVKLSYTKAIAQSTVHRVARGGIVTAYAAVTPRVDISDDGLIGGLINPKKWSADDSHSHRIAVICGGGRRGRRVVIRANGYANHASALEEWDDTP